MSDYPYCEQHHKFPCRECKVYHFDGCHCGFCYERDPVLREAEHLQRISALESELKKHQFDRMTEYSAKCLEAKVLREALDELANGYAGNGWDIGLVPRIDKARRVLQATQLPTRPLPAHKKVRQAPAATAPEEK